MSAIVPVNQRGMGLHIVGDQPDSKSVILSCNGIQNSLEDAKKMGRSISEKFGGRQVYVFHNPTTLSQYWDPKQRRIQEGKLAHALALNICRLQVEKKSLQIFAHSHGAVLVEKALDKIGKTKGLGSKVADKVEVYAFGGATIIPNRLAKKVQNYVFEEDGIAELGNRTSLEVRPKEEIEAISEIKELNKLMRTEGLSRDEAIRKKVNQDVLWLNCPLNALVKKYEGYFERYNIESLPSSEFDHPEYTDLSKTKGLWNKIKAGVSNVWAGAAAFGSHFLDNHSFTSYEHIVDQIAEQDLRRMK